MLLLDPCLSREARKTLYQRDTPTCRLEEAELGKDSLGVVGVVAMVVESALAAAAVGAGMPDGS